MADEQDRWSDEGQGSSGRQEKAAPKATAAKKAAPKKTKPAAKAAPKTAAPKATAAKKAAPKKAAGPKLSPTQHGLLEKISAAAEPLPR